LVETAMVVAAGVGMAEARWAAGVG
jgi:hypothetical protein